MQIRKKLSFAIVSALTVASLGISSLAWARLPGSQSTSSSSSTSTTYKKESSRDNSAKKSSFAISNSSAGNSRSDIALKVQQREDEQRRKEAQYAQQLAESRRAAAEKDARDRANAARLQAQIEKDRLAQQKSAKQPNNSGYASSYGSPGTYRDSENSRLRREAQALKERQDQLEQQLEYQRRVSRMEAERALREAEDAKRAARNAAWGGAATGGVIGYEVGRHSTQPNYGSYPNPSNTVPPQQGTVTPPQGGLIEPPVNSVQEDGRANSNKPRSVRQDFEPTPGVKTGSAGIIFLVVGLCAVVGIGFWYYRTTSKREKQKMSEFERSASAKTSTAKATTPVEPTAQPTQPITGLNVAERSGMEVEMVNFFNKLQSYYNEKNAEALTAMTSPEMLSAIKEGFNDNGFKPSKFSNVHASIEEDTDLSVVVYFQADCEEESGTSKLKEVWNIKKDSFGYILDGIQTIE